MSIHYNYSFTQHRLFFLLGAGASARAGVPTNKDFIPKFSDYLETHNEYFSPLIKTFKLIKNECNNKQKSAVVELDLEVFYEILYSINRPRIISPILHGFRGTFPKKGRETELLEYELKKFIQKKCLEINSKKVKYLSPLLKFCELSRILDVVSLNYDVCIERLCNSQGFKYSYGLDKNSPFYNPFKICSKEKIEEPLIRLFKLHGSVTWYEIEPRMYQQLLERNQFSISLKMGRLSTPVLRGMMIYPGIGKDLTSKPFSELFSYFKQLVLNSDICISMGYRFADPHVKKITFEGLHQNNNLTLIIVNDEAERIKKHISEEAGLTDARVIPIKVSVEEVLKNDYLLKEVKNLFKKRNDKEQK